MAHAGRDTGGSQFFLTFVPTPQLNGDHSLGRVIEALTFLRRSSDANPDKPADLALTSDKMLKVEVIHKRDHKYEPNKVK